MKSDKVTNRIGLYLLLAFFATIALGSFVMKPLYDNISATNAEKAKIKQQIVALEQLEEDTEVLRQNYQSVKSQRDEILSLLPTDTQEERLVAVLNDLAVQSGVVMTAFSPEGAGAAELAGLSIYPVKITVSGNYSSVKTFLSKVETGARFVDVLGASISGGQAGGISSSISLKAYYQTSTPQGGTN